MVNINKLIENIVRYFVYCDNKGKMWFIGYVICY